MAMYYAFQHMGFTARFFINAFPPHTLPCNSLTSHNHNTHCRLPTNTQLVLAEIGPEFTLKALAIAILDVLLSGGRPDEVIWQSWGRGLAHHLSG